MPCSVYFTQEQLEGIQQRMREYAGKLENLGVKDDKKQENRLEEQLDRIVSEIIWDFW